MPLAKGNVNVTITHECLVYGEHQPVGTKLEVSKADAARLIHMKRATADKATLIKVLGAKGAEAEAAEEEAEEATDEERETATQPRRRQA